jgi:hypothetical protein
VNQAYHLKLRPAILPLLLQAYKENFHDSYRFDECEESRDIYEAAESQATNPVPRRFVVDDEDAKDEQQLLAPKKNLYEVLARMRSHIQVETDSESEAEWA